MINSSDDGVTADMPSARVLLLTFDITQLRVRFAAWEVITKLVTVWYLNEESLV